MNDELIKKLKNDSYFQQFMGFVFEKIDELKDNDDYIKMSRDEAGDTIKMRTMTRVKLMEILEPFIEFNEKKGPSRDEIKKAEEKVGL